MSETLLPQLPIEPGDGGEDPPPPPPSPVSITQVSPIAAALAGGIDITITGSGFQSGAQVFFGSSQSPRVTFVSSTMLRVVLPPASQTGSVNVTVVNPSGSNATRSGAFTYITMNNSGRAEVIGVDPLAVIEDSLTDVTLRGRNLIAAHNAGLLVLRGPARATLAISNFRSTTDAATGIEEITVSVRVTASPPLAAQERLVVQILASRRPGALTDGVFESSRQLFTVLPKTVPVLLGYTANLDPSKPSVVVVTGKNLSGCSLNLGPNATIHIQKSEDDILAGIVSVPANQPPPDLSVLSTVKTEIARLDMALMTDTSQAVASGDQASMLAAPGPAGLELTAVPGQKVVAPAQQDSRVFKLSGAAPSNLGFNWSNFDVAVFDVIFRFRIINIVRLIPFFDGGGDMENPIAPQAGRLFSVRGSGLLFALRVEITITITVVLVIGFRFEILGFGLFNEFPEFSWGIGSFVIGFRVAIDVDINIHSMTALVLPNGRLQVLAVVDLQIGIDFDITNNGFHLRFDPRFNHRVIFRDIKPIHPLFLCEGRFQLAEDNGQTVFTDASGGRQSFYFARAAGQCCLTWRFDLELVRFTDGGPETTVQQAFNADLCLNAAPATGLANLIITSENPAPTGIPPRLVMTFADRARLKCLAQPVDAAGNPTGAPAQDVTTLGYNVEFFTDPLAPDVLDPTLIGPGDAAPVLAGDSLIRARVWPRQNEVQLFTFAPGGISGFSIINQLSRGLLPAVIGSNPLPVTVQSATQIAVIPTLVFVDPLNPNARIESPSLFTLQGEPVREVERFEPFETQRVYRLAVKLTFPSSFSFPATLKFKISTLEMRMVKNRGTNTAVTTAPVSEAPLANTSFIGRTANNTAANFFAQLGPVNQEVTITLASRPSGSIPIELPGLTIAPNTREETGQNKLVPPGQGVANKEVVLLLNLQETSGAPVAPIKQLKLGVRNDETYEEYVRVFKEVRTIMTGNPLEHFARDFFASLPATGAPDAGALATKGNDLWTRAVSNVLTSNDDRPLYWARLESICALRAHFKRKNLGTPTILPFELPSRGLGQDGKLNLSGLPAGRKVVVTGFDPFQLPTQPNQSNPSGLIALVLEGREVDLVQPRAIVKSAIFPVRYRDFDANIVENAVGGSVAGTILDSIVLLVSTSMNDNDYYDVERFAGRARSGIIDNENQTRAAGSVTGGPEFNQSTLPYERVITGVEQTRRLTGPNRPGTPFVTDQSYKVVGASGQRGRTSTPTASPAPVPGQFRPEPVDDGTIHDRAAWEKVNETPGGASLEGSGFSYLSNEIFYRISRARDGAPRSLASGHLHLPLISAGGAWSRTGLISGVKEALRRFLVTGFRFAGPGDVTFPNTVINGTSAPQTFTASNETNQPVTVATAVVTGPFRVTSMLPVTVAGHDFLSLQLTFSPLTVGSHVGTLELRDAAGEVLCTATLRGAGVATPPAPVITSFDPIAGEVGDSFTISGANLATATRVLIGTLATTFGVVNDNEIIADVSGPPRLVQITVITPSGTAVSSGFFRVVFVRQPPENL